MTPTQFIAKGKFKRTTTFRAGENTQWQPLSDIVLRAKLSKKGSKYKPKWRKPPFMRTMQEYLACEFFRIRVNKGMYFLEESWSGTEWWSTWSLNPDELARMKRRVMRMQKAGFLEELYTEYSL